MKTALLFFLEWMKRAGGNTDEIGFSDEKVFKGADSSGGLLNRLYMNKVSQLRRNIQIIVIYDI